MAAGGTRGGGARGGAAEREAADARVATARRVRTVEAGPRAETFVWGRSAAMRDLRERVRAVAATDAGILLLGETGTGKGALARLVHATSPRRASPFVHFDCAGAAPGLIESALFGHERGAFTGAHARRIGRVEAAADGTLFLDEVGELERAPQARLLRLLQDRVFERVGGARTIAVRARIVAATHRDLALEVAAGRFREDLLHRLAVVALRVPPVRERREDLPELLARAAVRAGARTGAPPVRLGADALRVLGAWAWPGNVREIMNAMERAAACWPGRPVDAALARRLLEGPALGAPPPTAPSTGSQGPSPPVTAGSDATRLGPTRASSPVGAGPGEARPAAEAVAAALARCGGNVSAAARLLGMPRSTLRYRLGRAAGEGRQLALPGLERD